MSLGQNNWSIPPTQESSRRVLVKTRNLGISSRHVRTTHCLSELFTLCWLSWQLKTPDVGHSPDSTGEGGLWGAEGPVWSFWPTKDSQRACQMTFRNGLQSTPTLRIQLPDFSAMNPQPRSSKSLASTYALPSRRADASLLPRRCCYKSQRKLHPVAPGRPNGEPQVCHDSVHRLTQRYWAFPSASLPPVAAAPTFRHLGRLTGKNHVIPQTSFLLASNFP